MTNRISTSPSDSSARAVQVTPSLSTYLIQSSHIDSIPYRLHKTSPYLLTFLITSLSSQSTRLFFSILFLSRDKSFQIRPPRLLCAFLCDPTHADESRHAATCRSTNRIDTVLISSFDKPHQVRPSRQIVSNPLNTTTRRMSAPSGSVRTTTLLPSLLTTSDYPTPLPFDAV